MLPGVANNVRRLSGGGGGAQTEKAQKTRVTWANSNILSNAKHSEQKVHFTICKFIKYI